MKSVLTAVAMVSALVSVTPVHADAYRSITMEFGADRPGADYRNVQLTTNDPLACQVLCAQDNACRAYSFVPAGALTLDPRGPIARCYLKNLVPAQRSFPGVISGWKLP